MGKFGSQVCICKEKSLIQQPKQKFMQIGKIS